MTATARRAVVAEVQAAVPVSEREACRYVGVARSTLRYQPSRDDAPLRAQLEQLAVERPRWGYRRLTVLLRRGGVLVNHKRVYRVYRAAGLAVRRRRRKRVAVPRRPLVPASRPNERWSMDFVTDRFGAERRFRALAIVDDFTRECLALEVDTSLPGTRVCRVLDALAVERGVPATIVTDNGPEFAGRALDIWAYRHHVHLAFIQPGKPTQNAYIESFNGKLRDECLAQRWFFTLAEADSSSRTGAGITTPNGRIAVWTTSRPASSLRAGPARTPTLWTPELRYELVQIRGAGHCHRPARVS